MKELIYCSQCHNSAYCSAKHAFGWDEKFPDDKIVLYCHAHKRYMPANQTIGDCTALIPENAEHLLAGRWKPRTANEHKK